MNATTRLGVIIVLMLTLLAPTATAADVEYVKTLAVTPAPEVSGFINSFWTGKYFFVRTASCTASTPGYRGTWVFDEAGNLIGDRDTAWDAGNFDCWQHSWQLGLQIARVDDNGVIFGNGLNYRSPIYYAVRNGKVEVIARANQNPPWTSCAGCNPGTQEYDIGPNVGVTQNGYVVANKRTADGTTTAVFRLPTFQEVGSGPEMSVIGAVGNYVIGWTSTTTPTGRVTTGVVYRIDDNGQLTFVKNIPALATERGTIVDQWNPNRALLHGTVRENSVTKNIWKIYEATPTDLIEVYSKESPTANTGVSAPQPVALAGDYIAVIAHRPPTNPGTAALWESRPVELWKTTGDQKLIFQAPPGVVTNPGYPAQPAMGGSAVGISKTGKIVVATTYATYLYQVRDFQGSGSGSSGGDIPACKTTGESCAGYSDCCSQSCAAGVCVGGQAFSPPTNDECEIDDDCAFGWCDDGTCEVECDTNTDCTAGESCIAGLCTVSTQEESATFAQEFATCTIGTGKFYCTATISWTSTGTGKLQLWRDDKRLLSCGNAGLPGTKNLRATTTPHEYQLYAATSCDASAADRSEALDTITVQATR